MTVSQLVILRQSLGLTSPVPSGVLMVFILLSWQPGMMDISYAWPKSWRSHHLPDDAVLRQACLSKNATSQARMFLPSGSVLTACVLVKLGFIRTIHTSDKMFLKKKKKDWHVLEDLGWMFFSNTWRSLKRKLTVGKKAFVFANSSALAGEICLFKCFRRQSSCGRLFLQTRRGEVLQYHWAETSSSFPFGGYSGR